jgi:drug/metabolite transporter (DMT)-like permease
MTSAVSAGVIMASIPAVVALLSWLLLHERPTPRVWAATACAVFGIGLLAWSHAPATAPAGGAVEPHPWLGNLLVFCAVLCEAIYAVIGKKLIGALSPRRITSLINLWGLFLTTPMGLYYALHFDFGAMQAKAWLLLLFYGLAASVWTVWLWMTGLKRIPANLAGVFTVMLPISATLTGVLALGETLSGVRAAALLISLVGVVLATMPGASSKSQGSPAVL